MSATIEIADVIELLAAEGDSELELLRDQARAHYNAVHKDHLVSFQSHLVTVLYSHSLRDKSLPHTR